MVEYKDRLEEAMKARGVSVTTLAAELGLTYQGVSKVRSGASKAFTAANNARAAAFLGVDPYWLATGQGQPPSTEAGVPMPVGAKPSLRTAIEYLAEVAAQQRPTLRKNMANLLVELMEHPDDPARVEQTVKDVERFVAK